MNFQLVKGTHDIINKEARYYQQIESLFISLAELYGYNEFRTPIIEYTELFKRDKNDSSDMVRKQMYEFNDLGGRSLTLRPEGTASVARAIVNNKLYVENDFPIKAYYIGPVFRYERPKAGTYRQFLQFGIENIGIDNPYSDVETIILSFRALKMLGFNNLKLKINCLGDQESRDNYKKALVKHFTPLIDKMCPDCKERLKLNPLRIIDCKVPADQELVKHAPKMGEYLSKASKDRFAKTIQLLKDVGIPYEIDEGIVRGLDYYSHIVYEYEYISKSGLNVGALGGGGHYDNLVKEIGGPQLAGVGFAFGIERIYSLLKDEGLLPKLNDGFDFMVMPVGEKCISRAFIVADFLRMLGYKAEAIIENKSFKSMFHKAEKRGTAYAVLIGENELKNNEVIVKDMKTQKQTNVKNKDLKEYVNSLFGHDCHCHDGECHCEEHKHGKK
ncbi:MAG: histidine--tRNA ligase [Bacilli bacterium]|nr:histidine--tRNA ligase [Bacilli bacterium]